MASIVDYLKSIGQPTDFASRAKLAAQLGIKNYSGTAAQNTQLLAAVQSGAQSKAPADFIGGGTLTGSSFGGTMSPSMGFKPTGTTAPAAGTATVQTSGTGTGAAGAGSSGVSGATGGSGTGGISMGGGTGGTTTQTGGTTQSATDYTAQLREMGFTDSQISTMSQDTRASLSMYYDYMKNNWGMGVTNQSINAADWEKAKAYAASDPDIAARYGDALKMGMADFQNNLTEWQKAADITAAQQATTMTQDQKNLAEAEAAAGRAYSGFREQAKSQLAQQQSGVVESTRAQLRQNLQQLGASAESKFGTAATPPANLTYVNPLTGQSEAIGYKPVGGITGSETTSKAQDIYNKAVSSYDLTRYPVK